MSRQAGPLLDDELLLQLVAEVLQPEPLSREAVAAAGGAAWSWHEGLVALDRVPRHPGTGHDGSTRPSPCTPARRDRSRSSGRLGRSLLRGLAVLLTVRGTPAYRRLPAWHRIRWTAAPRGGGRARPCCPVCDIWDDEPAGATPA